MKRGVEKVVGDEPASAAVENSPRALVTTDGAASGNSAEEKKAVATATASAAA